MIIVNIVSIQLMKLKKEMICSVVKCKAKTGLHIQSNTIIRQALQLNKDKNLIHIVIFIS